MRPGLIIGAACLALASCGPGDRPTGQAQPPPARVTAQPPAASYGEQTMLTQAAEIRSALLPSLLAKNCRSAGGSVPCRNLAIPCAFQESVNPSDQANGVAYRLVFATAYEAEPTPGSWQAGGEFLRVEIAPDGGWNSVGVADRNGAACSGDTENQLVRVLTFSP